MLRTPRVVTHPGVHAELVSAISVPHESIRSPDVVHFLRQVLRQVPGKLLILWDGAPIHRSQEGLAHLAAGATRRLHLEHFPACAPELNPDEGIWQYLNHVELRNLSSRTRWDLHHKLHLAARRLRRKHHVIQGCVRQALGAR